MLLSSVHLATSVATLLLLSTSTHAQTSPTTNNWGGCAMCPAEPPKCEPGCAKCVVTLGSCTECATARCAPAGDDDGSLGPLSDNPINAKLPGGASVSVGTEGGSATGGGVVESSEKQKSAGSRWQVTQVSTVGALVVAGVLVAA